MPRKPISGIEQQLARLAGEDITPREPASAVEEWLEIIYDEGGGGGGGGTGQDGITPIVSVSSISGGHNIAFSYGSGDPRNTDFDVMDGSDGATGQDGYTPVRGTDYWTANDVAEIELHCDTYIDAAVAAVAPTIINDGASVAAQAFKNDTTISSVTYPSATSVGNEAFYGCTSLITANLPSATSLGDSVFRGDTSLTTVSTLTNLTSAGNETFYGCTSLTSVSMPAVISLGTSTFNGCTALSSVSLPSCRIMGENAFTGCRTLETVSLPSVVNLDGWRTFQDCQLLKTIDLCSPNRTDIPLAPSARQMFENCFSLTAIYINDDLVDTLKAATGWSDKASIIYGESDKPSA